MKNFFVCLVAFVFISCAEFPIQGTRTTSDGRQIVYTTPATGGMEVVIENSVLGTKFRAQVLGVRLPYDKVWEDSVPVGGLSQFFFRNSPVRRRNEVTIVLQFFSDDARQEYLGSHEIRVYLRGNFGEYESEFFRVSSISRPREVPRY